MKRHDPRRKENDQGKEEEEKEEQKEGVRYVPNAQQPPVRHGFFRAAICSQRQGFHDQVMKKFSATSWKELNGMLERERVELQKISSTVEEYSRELGNAINTRSLEKARLKACPFVLFFKQPHVLSHKYGIALSSLGFSAPSSLRGSPGGPQQLHDGDVIIVKRGIQEISEPFVTEKDLVFRPEINYAAGGGGGWSGGGGGGYGGRGGGGGGGGGSFVSNLAKSVSKYVGYQTVKGRVELRGNEGNGFVRILDVILEDEWLFKYSGRVELWTVPIKSTYALRVAGAGAAGAGDRKGGTGAVIEAQFHLEEGERVLLLVGGTSSTLSDSMGSCSGGAGGTFVFKKELSSGAVLVAAGGGGGATDSITTPGSDGRDASLEEHGSSGLGENAGVGGRDGASGSSRPVSSCYFNAAAASRPSEEKLFKFCLEKLSGSLPGGGSGIKQTLESMKGSRLPAELPRASGGFGGGGMGVAYPEQAQVRGSMIDSVFCCLRGSSRVESIILELLGRNDSFQWPPQCAKVEGGRMELVHVDVTTEAGNGVVVKGEGEGAALMMKASQVRGCGGNGVLVMEQGRVELAEVKVCECAKDGVDVKGGGVSFLGIALEVTESGQRGLVVGKGAQVKVEGSMISRSRWSGVSVNDYQTSLSMLQTKVTQSKKNGLWILNGSSVELRKCAVLDNESIGILAIGIQDKDLKERETSVHVSHSTVKGNGYGVWSQDAAVIKVVNCAIFGSVNEDIAQHSQPNMKIASSFFSPKFQLGLTFRSWAGISKASVLFTQKIDGLTGDELVRAIQEIFEKMDVDGSGRVGVAELSEAMEVLGMKKMEGEVYAMIRQNDVDEDGVLSMEEFSHFCYSSLLKRRGSMQRKKIMREKGMIAYTKPQQDQPGTSLAADDVSIPGDFSIEQMVENRLTGRAIIVRDGRDRAREVKQAELDGQVKDSQAFIDLLQTFHYTMFEVDEDVFVINSLLEQAQDHDAVIIGRGRYELTGTPLKEMKHISIVSAYGCTSLDCVLSCRDLSLNLSLVGVTVDVQGGEAHGAQVNICEAQQQLQLTSCILSSQDLTLCVLAGASLELVNSELKSSCLKSFGDLRLKDSSVSKSRSCGLVLVGGTMEAVGSIICECMEDGLTVGARGSAVLTGCKIVRCRRGVVCEEKRSRMSLRSSIIRENATDGVLVCDGAGVQLDSCDVLLNRAAGVRARGSGTTLRASETVIHANGEDGVSVEDGAAVTLWGAEGGRKSYVRRNGRNGLTVKGSGTVVTCSDMRVHDNESSGLAVTEGASMQARFCSFEGNGGSGILLSQQARAQLSFGASRANGRGLVVMEEATALLEEFECQHNTAEQVFTSDGTVQLKNRTSKGAEQPLPAISPDPPPVPAAAPAAATGARKCRPDSPYRYDPRRKVVFPSISSPAQGAATDRKKES